MALPQPSRPRLIENLIRILRNVGFEPSSSDLADIIWLAGYLDAPPEPLLQQERSGTQLPSLPEKEQSPSPSKEQDTPPSVTKAESPSSPSSAGLFTNESSGLFLTTPGGSALPGKLSISRALRPLMRRAPSLNLKEIDEDATVQRIADENNWTPILRPELSRWLELDLLIDTWPSMVIWQPAIRELFQLLEQQGAFQTIRYWEMETNEHHHSVHLYAGLRENQGSSRSPKELVEIRGNRLILVISDCLSPAWYEGQMGRLFKKWGYHQMVALVQVMPERMWSRTGLGNATRVWLKSRSPGTPNYYLQQQLLWEKIDSFDRNGFPIPVITLEPEFINAWAGMIIGKDNQWTPGFLLPLDNKTEQQRQAEFGTPPEPTPEERLEIFQSLASPQAYQLATYLAAAPLSLPVMRLVQRVMVPDSRQVHLAEFFLSGLIRRKGIINYSNRESTGNIVQYEFLPGVRERLLVQSPISDTLEVLRSVTKFVDRRTGQPIDFRAVVANPHLLEHVNLKTDGELFAFVASQVLRPLGGAYADLANQLDLFGDTSANGPKEQNFVDKHNPGTILEPKAGIRGRRFALIIANGEYDDPQLPDLGTPKNDAEGMARVLGSPAVGGFDVRTLVDQPFMEVRKAIAQFFEDKRRDDLLLLYFSGHSIHTLTSAGLCLAVKDTKKDAPRQRGIEASYINQRMNLEDRSFNRVILIFDCCYSGAVHTVFKSAGLPDTSAPINSGRGQVILTASRAVETAQAVTTPPGTDHPSPYSLFTHYLIEGLETGAAAGPAAEFITAEALYQYAFDKIQADPRAAGQTPRMKTGDREGLALQIAHSVRFRRPTMVEPILGHHFMCYSPVDGQAPAAALYDGLIQAGLPAWLDQEDARPDLDFDTQVEEALRGCASLVLVLTAGSAASADAERKWRRALRYKKPVILARFAPGVQPPLMLSNRHIIDFSGDLASAVEALRLYLAWRATPQGLLVTYQERLADAQRDLRPAQGAERARIQGEIDLLNQQIAEQAEILRDPQKAAQRAQDLINSGLERERRPETPQTGRAQAQFINPPPAVAPVYFQDRTVETGLIGDFLKDPAVRLITVVGRAGIGKTALVCRLLKHLESGRLPDGGGPLRTEGIVYLSAVGSHPVSFANLFADLCKLLPQSEAAELDALYRDGKMPPAEKMRALLAHFPPAAGEAEDRPVVALLDNFEDLLDPETQALRDGELEEALFALLDALPHRVKVLVTTRQACRPLLLRQPARQRRLELDSGLESPYAENILRAMDTDGTVGLKTAPDALLAQARARTRGYPRALEALYGILSADRYTRLEDVLAGAQDLLPEDVVAALVGQAFSRLDPTAQLVLQALAVYARPVAPAAVDYLLQPFRPEVDSAAVLHRLVGMHFARREQGRCYLHPVDRAYVFARIPLEPEGEPFTQKALLHRAADYFAQARLPQAKWKKLDDLSAQLAEIDLRCAAGEYDAAEQVLREIDFDYLLLWGHAQLLIELHERLRDHLIGRDLRMSSLIMLGLAYSDIGQARKAIDCYERGQIEAREVMDHSWESTYLCNLGRAYAALGQTARAIEYYEQALTIDREISDRRGEGNNLIGLGSAYAALGQTARAIEYYQQALAIHREIGDRRGEGNDLGNLGSAYLNLGQTARAIEYDEQALTIRREIGDRRGEGNDLGNLSNRYAALGQTARAIEYYQQALTIRRETGDRRGEGYALSNLSQSILDQGNFASASEYLSQALQAADEVGDPIIQNETRHFTALVYLIQGDFVSAQAWIEQASQYDWPQNNASVSALLGVIALRQGHADAARQAFHRAVEQADGLLAHTSQLYDALDTKGLALCGLALVEDRTLSAAAETYRAARAINRDAGVVQRVLRLFDQLALGDPQGRLTQVRPVAAGAESAVPGDPQA